MKFTLKYTCPYCNTDQDVSLDKNNQYADFYTVYCDIMQGGCDKPVTLKVELKPSLMNVYKLKDNDHE